MGDGYTLKCKSCGKKYQVMLGVGFRYPIEYDQLMEDIVGGKYGDEMQRLCRGSNDVVVDGEKSVYHCNSCGFWDIQHNLDLYRVPVEPGETRDFTALWSEEDNCTLISEYQHTCLKCSTVMKRANLGTKLRCLNCGGSLEKEGFIMWD